MPYEPTSEQCDKNTIVEYDGVRYLATWYPQIGGSAAKCAVRFDMGSNNRCFDCFVWHDGEFPFSGGNPVELHHCDPEQFIRFGELVKRLQAR